MTKYLCGNVLGPPFHRGGICLHPWVEQKVHFKNKEIVSRKHLPTLPPVCVCVCAYTYIVMCVLVCGILACVLTYMQRQEATIKCPLQSFYPLFSETGFLAKSGAHQLGQHGWATGLRDFLSLPSGSSVRTEDNGSLMFIWQALYCLSRLPSSLSQVFEVLGACPQGSWRGSLL